jgi:hypothetical protein
VRLQILRALLILQLKRIQSTLNFVRWHQVNTNISRSSPKTGPIIGGVLGGLAVVIFGAVLVWYIKGRNRPAERNVNLPHGQPPPPPPPPPPPIAQPQGWDEVDELLKNIATANPQNPRTNNSPHI